MQLKTQDGQMVRTKYNREDMVYLVSDPEQYRRQVVGIIWRGILVYEVACGGEVTEHEEFELSDTKIYQS